MMFSVLIIVFLMINVFLINFFFWPFKVTVIQATSLDLKTLNEEPDIYDLPIAPLFGSFSSPCKEPAKPKDEHQNYFILEKSVYNSFNGTTSKLMIPCTYMTSTSNGRHSSVVESSKAPAVFSVAGELFVGNNLVQIDCSEIEWLFLVLLFETPAHFLNYF